MEDNNICIEVHDLTVSYHTKPVLWNIDCQIPSGKLVAIVGPNGAGKSTLIKAMIQLIPAASGWVKIFGKPYKQVRLDVGYVPQRESVDWDFPTTAIDVVCMGLYGKMGWFKRTGKKELEIAKKYLQQVGMEQFSDRQISQLSGGQQQRVFLARALAQEAQIYLMDEPFAGVDAVTEKAIVELLFDLKKQGKTVLVVHHDLPTVKEYFDWVILLNLCLIAAGPTEQVFNEDNLRKTYGGRSSILTQVAEATMKGKENGFVE